MPSTQPLCPGSSRWQEREWLLAQDALWWEDVFDRIACGVPPTAIAEEQALRYAILVRVIGEDDKRQAEYEAALRIAADGYAHEVVKIADTQEVGETEKVFADGTSEVTRGDMLAHRKLRIETRMRLAGKWHRARYGDSVTVETVKRVVLDLKFGARKAEGDVEDAVVVEPPRLGMAENSVAPEKILAPAEAEPV